ncbi:MAG: Slp family lipoprotein [Desulfobacteraceae bacterium]|nr:Slp family lipoprotein [Desulfobacteraceae bacterium]
MDAALFSVNWIRLLYTHKLARQTKILAIAKGLAALRRSFGILAFLSFLAVGCSAIPAAITKKALPAMPFPVLVQQAHQYIGDTLILGGYVLEVQNHKDETRLVAMQAPLDADQRPKTRDLSQGILILKYNGSLDPRKYSKDRKITVAGELMGSSATKEPPSPYPYVELKLTHIHLWPD